MLPLIVLFGGLLVSGGVAALMWRTVEAQDRERFAYSVGQANDAVADRLETYIAMLRAGAGLFSATASEIDRQRFHAFVERLQLATRYPGIQGIGFSLRLPPASLPALTAVMRRQGFEDFRVWPEAPRPEYHSILFLEPLDARNRAAIGYDMATEPVRRAAMERARDTGEPAASGRVELVQEIDEQKQPGFLIYVPVYRGGGVPASLAERRANLVGFVYSPFRVDDLMHGIFRGEGNPRVDYTVYDGEPRPESLLHLSHVAGWEPRYTASRVVDVAGRLWTTVYSTSPSFEHGLRQPVVPFFFGGGVLATLLVSGALWLQTRARLAAEREVAERRRAEGRQKLLLAELNHRVKNTLAAVQSIAAQTLRGAASPETFRDAFQARLLALSQAHNLLTRGNWEGAPLSELVAAETAPWRGVGPERFTVEGEAVWLRPNAAVALGMALHELATNAAKHGALSVPEGRVAVRWAVTGEEPERRLVLVWRERGGPPVRPPERRGFGSRLIERGLAHELGGEARLDFAPEGLVCTLDMPLAEAMPAAGPGPGTEPPAAAEAPRAR